MSEFLQQLINGLSLGAIYALIALGYTLVYGILRFINFAHSDVVAWGAWIALTVASMAGWLASGSPWFALPVVLLVTMALCAAMGVTIERLAYRPLRKAPRLNVLITAIGVSLFMQNVGLLNKVFGNRPATISGLLDNKVLATIGGVQIRLFDMLTIGLT